MIRPQDKTKPVDELKSYMVGKTIKEIDESACNCIGIEFTDGTELLLEVEAANGSIGLYGVTGYIRE